MNAEFKYDIGSIVASVVHIDEIRHLFKAPVPFMSIRPETMRVMEQIWTRCIGGVQRFYYCEDRNGGTYRFSEDSLVPGDRVWDVWLEGLKLQEAQKKERS